MNQNKIKTNSIKMIFAVVLLMIFSSFAYAEQQGNLPITSEDRYSNFVDLAKELRVFQGGLCQDLPDDSGTPDPELGYRVWCTGPNGVTSDMTGCVVLFFDSSWRVIREDTLNPGENTREAPTNAAYWQRYNCFEEQYICTDFDSKGCGKSGSYAVCNDNEMLRVRECSGAPSSIETERCIPWTICVGTKTCEYFSSNWGACEDGKQSRYIVTESCEEYTDYQDCALDCSNPAGEPGEIQCINEKEYQCKGSTGKWLDVGTCSGTNPGTNPPSNPSASANIISKGTTAYYDPTSEQVIGRAEFQNTGEDMTDTYILEMQVVPKGEPHFAFISNQMTCDPTHPENVHKQFMLGKGESSVIQLQVPKSVTGEGEFDIYFLTRHKCYKDLTPEQLNNHNEYQLVGPIPDYKKVATLTVGNPITASGNIMWIILGWMAVLLGIVFVALGGLPVGIGAFVIGVILLIWQYLF